MYSTGYETENEMAQTNTCKDFGCTWDLYKNCKARFSPSINKASMYQDLIIKFAAQFSITHVNGYIEWVQFSNDWRGAGPGPAPTPPPIPVNPNPNPNPPSESELIRSYYAWNWGNGSVGSGAANVGTEFTGLVGV